VRCLFCSFSSVTVRVCTSVFRVHSWLWDSHGQERPLPEADINAIFLKVTHSLTSALRTIHSVSDLQVHWCTIYRTLKTVSASAKKSGHGVNFRTTPRRVLRYATHKHGVEVRSVVLIPRSVNSSTSRDQAARYDWPHQKTTFNHVRPRPQRRHPVRQ